MDESENKIIEAEHLVLNELVNMIDLWDALKENIFGRYRWIFTCFNENNITSSYFIETSEC